MKKTIALVTGGYSGESVISYKSADTIAANLDPTRWEYYLIDIHPDGWFYRSAGGESVAIDKNDFSLPLPSGRVHFDAVLIGLHGTPGEDGKLQGYFDCLGIPYTSCDAATSALTFNKRYTVAVAGMAGIPVASSVLLFREQPYAVDQIVDQVTFPVFVKPNNGGSSIGMSKVDEPAGLQAAIDKAFKEDTQVLIESAIPGREFTIGVFRHAGNVMPLPITEIISNNTFFDYEAKYHGASREVTPADIPEEMAEQIRTTAKQVYTVFNCRGVVRIDFIYHPTEKRPYMLEINTVPGQSAASIVPQQVQAMGWTLQAFYSALLDSCLAQTPPA